MGFAVPALSRGTTRDTGDRGIVRRLWPFIRPHRAHAVVAIVALAVFATIRITQPIVAGAVVDRACDHDMRGFVHAGALLTVLFISRPLLRFLFAYQTELCGARTAASLRHHVFRFLQTVTFRFLDGTPVGALVTRVTNDVEAVGELFSAEVLGAFGDTVTLIGYATAMLVLDRVLALVVFASLPFVLVIVRYARRRSRVAFREIRVRTAELNGFLGEQLAGAAVVEAYGRGPAMARDFDEINRAHRQAGLRSIFYVSGLGAAIDLAATGSVAAMLMAVSVERARATASAPDFALVVTFAMYIRQFFDPLRSLAQQYALLQSAIAGIERTFQFLDTVETEGNPRDVGTSAHDVPNQAISMSRITFGYKPGVPVVRDVTLSVSRGQRVAIVGATGAGKSTLVSLLLRFYEVDEGTISIDGRDITTLSRRDLRRKVALVPQDVHLFPGTLLSNIGMADQQPDRGRALRALEQIGAAALFRSRHGSDAGDEWLDMRVEGRGANFSAGERQLIAFARALYTDAPFIVLDEATANVDSLTEARLQHALETTLRQRTAIIIAHRLSTIKAADRIVVMHGGAVVEEGTHDELLRKGGYYARLCSLQFPHGDGLESGVGQ